jgi:cytochrome oxidase Cu insertion factor (SCO1/SenC/PrrC family)
MLLSLVTVGGVAYLQYARVDKARLRKASMEQLTSPKPEPLPVIATLPDFTLIDSGERRVALNDLRGRVWVADFFFTYCAGPCPVMSRRMRELRQLLKEEKMDDVVCVSVSVDPDRDTPKVLAEYAEMMKAEPGRWLFLTGKKQQIYDLAIKGFKVGVDAEQPDEQILHSTRFVLIDRLGRIRGYYKALDDDEELDPQLAVPGRGMPADIKSRLLTDIRLLRQEGGK